jgi:ATP-binding cassette subfamily B protein
LSFILQVAQLNNLIESLPEGLQTQVGERGYQFSGGERQRLCIARTLLRQPTVLLLDEVTKALDTETQKAFTAALSSVSEGMTVIAIAHRLSTVRNADQIIILENGKIEEIGTHDNLIASGGIYAKMAMN